SNDFNGDGISDILFRNVAIAPDNPLHLYQMNSGVVTNNGPVGTIASNYLYGGSGDFDGNGNADTLWYNSASGEVLVQLRAGFNVIAEGAAGVVSPALNWGIKDTGDFNGDGRYDILWYNNVTGQVNAWMLNGVSFQNGGTIATVSPATQWQIKGTGDFNGD